MTWNCGSDLDKCTNTKKPGTHYTYEGAYECATQDQPANLQKLNIH